VVLLAEQFADIKNNSKQECKKIIVTPRCHQLFYQFCRAFYGFIVACAKGSIKGGC